MTSDMIKHYLSQQSRVNTLKPKLIPQSLQFQARVMLASLGWYHKWRVREVVCFCSQRGGGVSILLLMQQL